MQAFHPKWAIKVITLRVQIMTCTMIELSRGQQALVTTNIMARMAKRRQALEKLLAISPCFPHQVLVENWSYFSF